MLFTSSPERARLLRNLLAGAAVFVASMGGNFRTPLLPAIGDELSMTAASLGLIGTSFGIGRLVTDIPAGLMADRLGVHRIFGISGASLVVGAAVFAAAPVPLLVFGASVLLGVSSAMANTAGTTYFLTGATTARRGRAMAGFSAALLAGQAAGPAIGGALTTVGTWRTAMSVASVLGVGVVVGAVLAQRRVARAGGAPPRTARPTPHTPSAAKILVPAGGHAEGQPVGMGTGERWALYGVGFAMMFTISSMPQTLIPIIGGGALDLTVATIGAALGIGGIVRFVGTLLGGSLSDRFARKPVLAGGLLVYAFGVSLLAVNDSVALWFAAIIVTSVSSFGLAIASAMIGDRVPANRMGREIGRFRFVGDVGVVLGPMLAALTLDTVGQTAAALLVTAVLVTSVVALVTLVPTHVRTTVSG